MSLTEEAEIRPTRQQTERISRELLSPYQRWASIEVNKTPAQVREAFRKVLGRHVPLDRMQLAQGLLLPDNTYLYIISVSVVPHQAYGVYRSPSQKGLDLF